MLNPRPPFSNQSSTFPLNREQPYYDYGSLQPFPPGHDLAMPSQQIAYPVPGQMAYSGSTTPRSGETPNFADNMLRRKTPSGTINGAYESNAHGAQATKHMLVPRIDTPQAFSQFTQLDSLLHQAPYRQMQHHQFYGQTVPSVLQPPSQYLGPTASGVEGRGPYGPYWNDGTYVPYRPAALRDPRFYSAQHPGAQWGCGSGSIGVGYGRMYSRQSETSATLSYPASNARNANWPSLTHGGLALPYPHAPQTTTAFVQDAIQALEQQGPPQGSFPANAQHREQTFHWALQIYRDLLTYIHQVKKQKLQSGQPQSSPTRPSFYPKPPKLSGTPLPSPSTAETDPGAEELTPKPCLPSTPQYSSNGAAYHDPSIDGSMQPPSSYTLSNGSNRPGPLRRNSSSVSSIVTTSGAQDTSPPTRAISALAVVSALCQETDWQWIDGMHLGGCLAYGLGNYGKAQRWYTKVLELDPKHLEASSNLAATLVLLGHKEEAEHHWRRVVKDAPNHFEAVEHLVGLLCQSQRTKDAVKVIDHIQRSLRIARPYEPHKTYDHQSDCSMSNASRSPCLSDASDRALYDFEFEHDHFNKEPPGSSEPGFGSSGYAIPGSDNGRILALIHAKGNMLYSLGDNTGAAKSFEDAVLLSVGRKFSSVQELVRHVLSVISAQLSPGAPLQQQGSADPILLYPEQASQTARLCFPHYGELAGLRHVPCAPQNVAKNAAIATTSNSLLSLAKIFQDNMAVNSQGQGRKMINDVREILAIYYLSLSLQPSPSTANNVGILLAGVQQTALSSRSVFQPHQRSMKHNIPGVVPGSGIALALAYYNYGLMLDTRHAHLYTNLGSLLKDIGQLDAAIEMYKCAVQCDAKFDIALANLANAVKDKGRISDAIEYYKRAVEVNPEFAEAVCGLANALNSVCGWQGRGGIAIDNAKRDRWHVDARGMLIDGSEPGTVSTGWVKRVVDIVEKQLSDGESWGRGVLTPPVMEAVVQYVTLLEGDVAENIQRQQRLRRTLQSWAGKKWEGARVTRVVERATRRITWHWYRDSYILQEPREPKSYIRPQLPAALPVPHAPTVLPFHTFTAPMSARQIRQISQRNGYRISASTLRMPWLPVTVYPPPSPPRPYLKVGYVSSDFNNHPLAHLMQSVFGLHDPSRVQAICYATTAGDNSVHRQQIEAEAPVFHDASGWTSEQLVNKIIEEGVHILVNLNGYTRGARNEVFAARPAPIQMSFMGFAGTMGAEWCDYLLADETSVPQSALRPWRRNVDVEDVFVDEKDNDDQERESKEAGGGDWVYGENIVYCRDTFFCCDHKQSAPDSDGPRMSWEEEQRLRWRMRKELFPKLADDAVIFANFNQLYKIEPTTLRTWLRILSSLPTSILWLLRFPDLGETNIIDTARRWAGPEVASRIIFTDVAPKHLHISRAKVADLFLDTPECNAHTTAADCLWSGTPLLTRPRWTWKMCSRMAASILKGALPRDPGLRYLAERDLIAQSEEEYEALAIKLGKGLVYPKEGRGVGYGRGRLMELRKMLTEGRWSSALFDTRRWVRDLEDAMEEVWHRWERGEGGDVWLDKVPVGGRKRAAAQHGLRRKRS